jgi:L-amino acid N-acyltransferase YncA
VTRLRPARPEDAGAIARIYAPFVTDGVVSFEETPPGAEAIARRMADKVARYPWLVAEDGAVLGYAYAGPFRERAAYRWTAETTIYLDAAAQGRGLGRRLYAALLATLERQRFAQAVGVIALPNPASAALHEAMGFERVGCNPRSGWKAGRWIDVGLWQRPLARPADPPAEPIPFAALAPDWTEPPA